MSWVGPAAAAGASIVGGLIGAKGAKKAAKAQARSQQQALALQQQMYLTNLGINEPWRATGQGALNTLARLYGQPYQDYQPLQQLTSGLTAGNTAGTPHFGAKDIVRMLRSGMSVAEVAKLGALKLGKSGKRVKYLAQSGLSPEEIKMLQGGPSSFAAPPAPVNNLPTGGQAPAGPDMSVFTNSPGYQFRRSEGQRDIGNSFAARGGAFGGDALRALTDFNQNLASEDFYDFVNQQNIMAGYGQRSAENAGQYGQNFANAGSNAYSNMGNARASGIANQYNMLGQGLSGAANAFGNYWDNRTLPSITPPRFQFATDPRTLPIYGT